MLVTLKEYFRKPDPYADYHRVSLVGIYGPYLNQKSQAIRENIVELLMQYPKLLIDIDGSAGYSSTFLNAVFGGLNYYEGVPTEDLKQRILIKSDEDPSYKAEIEMYFNEPHAYFENRNLGAI